MQQKQSFINRTIQKNEEIRDLRHSRLSASMSEVSKIGAEEGQTTPRRRSSITKGDKLNKTIDLGQAGYNRYFLMLMMKVIKSALIISR